MFATVTVAEPLIITVNVPHDGNGDVLAVDRGDHLAIRKICAHRFDPRNVVGQNVSQLRQTEQICCLHTKCGQKSGERGVGGCKHGERSFP